MRKGTRFVIKTQRIPYLVNRAMKENIPVRQIVLGGGEVSLTVSRRDKRRFAALLTRERLLYREEKKRVLIRIKERPALLVALLFSVVAVVVFGSFVYGVNISGNHYVNTAAIQAVLRDHHVDGFIYKRAIDLEGIKRDVSALDGVSFASVGIKGNTLYVNVKEEFPDHVPDEENFDPVLAVRSGVVTKVVAESGTPRVKSGDVVAVGDVLIDAVYAFTEGGSPAPAKGEVWASTVYAKEIILPQVSVQNERTGRICSVRSVSWFGREATDEAEAPFEQYDVRKRMVFSAGIVTVWEKTYYERADVIVGHDFETEVPLLIEREREKLLSEVPFHAYATGGVVAEEKKMDNICYIMLYYTVVQRIDSLFLPNDT